jgi:hypothetical protein
VGRYEMRSFYHLPVNYHPQTIINNLIINNPLN